MKKIIRRALLLGSALLCFSSAYAAIPNGSDPTTFLGPTLRVGFTTPMTESTAFSVAGEAGFRNFRAGATIGWRIADNQRFKVSGEYLWQEIKYAFFAGNSYQWVNQGALGALYLYDFNDLETKPELDVGGFASYAPNKKLGTINGTFTNAQGVFQSFADHRRIAGSTAGGLKSGLTIRPWWGAKLGADVNYDYVRYNKKYHPGQSAIGLGATGHLDQQLMEDLELDLSAGVRQPFNDYEGRLAWSNVPFYGTWRIGLYGDYLVGKVDLPNTYNVGLSFDYFLEPSATPANLKGDYKDYKNERPVPVADDFLPWAADPAIHMPQVLAITDERVVIPNPNDPICEPVPVAVGTLPDQLNTGGNTSLPTAGAFSPSSGLTYSVTSNASGGNTVTINPITGLVTIHGASSQGITATVTASNPCGSASVPLRIAVIIIG